MLGIMITGSQQTSAVATRHDRHPEPSRHASDRGTCSRHIVLSLKRKGASSAPGFAHSRAPKPFQSWEASPGLPPPWTEASWPPMWLFLFDSHRHMAFRGSSASGTEDLGGTNRNEGGARASAGGGQGGSICEGRGPKAHLWTGNLAIY